MGSLREFLIDMGRNAYGLGENVASLGSAAIAEPVAGFAAMYDPANGAQAIREGMTYTPRTQAGQMYQQGAARTLGTIAKPAMPVIDAWQKGVDIAGRYSPVAGAALQTVPTALGALMGYKPAMQTGRQVSNSLGAMQARMVQNASAPRTLNMGYRGQRGTFAGINALTADRQALAKAQQMIAQGVDPEDVWQETGWGRGADGKWRFEINDKFDITDDGKEIGSGLNYNNGALSQLANGQIGVARGQQLLNHDDLYAAYPDFKNMEIRNAPDGLGFFDNNNTVGVNNRVLSGAVGGRDLGRTNSAHSILLHELQHAIQQREGFARGGNPEQFRGFYKDPYEAYRKLGGEVEARMVQNRMDLTPQQRRDIYPFAVGRYGYEDIPKDKQIINFDNNKAMSQRPLTEFEQAHLTAQRNAALPIEKGGLGLPANNTAMDRARAMGFKGEGVHYTPNDFAAFREGKGDYSAVWVTTDPKVNLAAHNIGHNGEMIEGTNGMPLLFNNQKRVTATDKWDNDITSNFPDNVSELDAQKLKALGFTHGAMGTQAAILDPKNIRSRFAAFDPFYRESSNLLAQYGAIAPTATLGAMMYNEQQRKKQGK